MKKQMLFCALCAAAPALAALRLSPVFSENMVLQRDRCIAVWGLAEPGERVAVAFAGHGASATAGETGEWTARLPPMEASFSNRTLVVSGAYETIALTNILVGDVWLASGQSNMEMPVWGENPRFRQVDGNRIAKAGANPNLRLLNVAPIYSGLRPDPGYDYDLHWRPASEESILPFSATAYFFGREIQEETGVPIGVFTAHCGGTGAELWTSPSGYEGGVKSLERFAERVRGRRPGTREHRKYARQVIDDYTGWLAEFRAAAASTNPPMAKADFEKAAAAYDEWLEKFKAAFEADEFAPAPPEKVEGVSGKVLPAPPAYPNELRVTYWPPQETGFYNRMIYPFSFGAVRGAIWYQGESNTGEADLPIYADMMEALLAGWRKDFRDPGMPLYFVQIAPFGGYAMDAAPRLWEQQQIFADRHRDSVHMAVINDHADLKDWHPADKRPVGHRLALLALKYTYGRADLKADAPRVAKSSVRHGAFVLGIANAEAIEVRGRLPFEVAGPDGAFHPAAAVVDGTTITVSSEAVPAPKFLRFSWGSTNEATLFNEAGLPMGAFRLEK